MENNYVLKNKDQKNSTWIKAAFAIILLLLFAIADLKAQLVGWKYRDGMTIQENAGVQNLNYQVLLNINTAALIGANKMHIKGNDIRFSKDCNGSVLLNYFIDTLTINTSSTQIWVMLDTLKASGNYPLYMWYGNSGAAAGSNFNNTFPISSQLIVTAGSVALSGTNTYSWFEIQAGASVIITPNSPFVINARKIKISGTLNGDGGGYLGGQTSMSGGGTGGGKPASILTPGNTSGGGGAYGGNGGNGTVAFGTNGDGGTAYGNATTIDMGSGGGGPIGGGAGATEGNGGAGITFNARVVEITGTINCNGNAGTSINGAGYGGGGGAGGGFLLHAYETLLSGTINANGGTGGDGAGGGGGGGGGRINLYSELSFLSGTYNVSGGFAGVTGNTANGPGSIGMPGAISTGTWTANEPTYNFIPHVVLTSSTMPVCEGTNVTFIAATGFTPYNFYVNGDSAQSSTSNTFSSTMLANNDTVKVLAGDANGCLDTSNIIMVTLYPLPSVTVSPSATICIGSSTSLAASGGNTYTWAPPAGLSSTSGPAVTASPTLTTNYSVTVTDGNGCQNTDTVTVTVEGCTNIAQHATSDLRAYPNPTHGAFTLHAYFTSPGAVTITLCDMLGETVKVIEHTELSGAYNKEINITELPNGIYFLALKTGQGVQIKKIIKH